MMSTPTSAQTLTLQLVFDPTNGICTTYGRFALDTPTLRSKVWIQNIGSSNPVVLPGNTASVTVLGSDPNTPVIQILLITSLPSGWSWSKSSGNDPYSVRITAVFGRAHHGNLRDQAYATPFSLHNQETTKLCTVFDQTYGTTASPIGSNNQCLLSLGVARFHSSALTSISPTSFTSQSGPGAFTITGVNLAGATLQWSPGASAFNVQTAATQITARLSRNQTMMAFPVPV
jgi:hypothetical protein